MAERKGRFGALAELQRQTPTAPTLPEPQAPAVPSDPGKGRGRPATGKRSNPEWKLYSHYLRRKTQRAAVARLQAEDDGRDLSDVLESLLGDWLKS